MLKISYFTGGVAQTNGFLVMTEAGTALAVDAPEGFVDWLDAQSIRVSTVLLTHQHFDHVQDAGRLQKEHGARILAFEAFSRELTLEALFSFATGTSLAVEAFKVDEELKGKSSVVAGGVEWKLEHIPGHASDSVVFISKSDLLVFGGDVLFQGSIGRADFPGGSMQLLLQGIEKKLLPLGNDFVVYPGHGPPTSIGQERRSNPYLEELG